MRVSRFASEVEYDRYVLLLAVVYAICVPVLYIRIGGGAISFVDVAAPVALLVILSKLRRFPAIFLPYLAYIACAVISVVLSPFSAGMDNFLLALRLLFISLPFWMMLSLVNPSREDVLKVFRWLTLGAAIAVAVGLALQALGIQIQDSQKIWVRGQGSIYRAGGLVGNSGEFGQTVAIFAILLLSCEALKIRIPVLWRLAGWMMIAAAIISSSSRASVVMILTFVVVMSAFNIKYIGRIVVVLLVGAVAGGVLLALNAGGNQDFLLAAIYRLDFLNLSGEGRFTETGRLDTWQTLSGQASMIPTFGYGYKMTQERFGFFIDNAFLLSWFEVGIFGTLCFLAFWILVGLSVANDCLSKANRFAPIAMGVFLAFLARMMTGGANASWSTAPIIFLILGLCMREAQLIRREARAASPTSGSSPAMGAPAPSAV